MKVYSGQCLLSDCGTETSLKDYLGNPIYSGDMVLVINEKYEYYDAEDPIELRFENRKEQDMNVVLAKGDSPNDWIFGWGTDTDYSENFKLKIVTSHDKIENGFKYTNFRYSEE